MLNRIQVATNGSAHLYVRCNARWSNHQLVDTRGHAVFALGDDVFAVFAVFAAVSTVMVVISDCAGDSLIGTTSFLAEPNIPYRYCCTENVNTESNIRHAVMLKPEFTQTPETKTRNQLYVYVYVYVYFCHIG